jgi:hypothetical protein
MAEIRVRADESTPAYVKVSEQQPIPHLVTTSCATQVEFTPGHGVARPGDISMSTVTRATAIATAATEWRDRLARPGQAAHTTSERFDR